MAEVVLYKFSQSRHLFVDRALLPVQSFSVTLESSASIKQITGKVESSEFRMDVNQELGLW